MMTPRLYLAYGLAVIGMMGYAQHAGWTMARVNENKVIPRSIRDNPGSYRSVYSPYQHYTGGK